LSARNSPNLRDRHDQSSKNFALRDVVSISVISKSLPDVAKLLTDKESNPSKTSALTVAQRAAGN